MLDENSRQVKSNSEVANSSPDNVEEVIQQLKIHDNQEQNTVARPNPCPNRLGQQVARGTHVVDEFPERVGQPDCAYYLKTGICNYGSICKYHHPKDRNGAGPALFNSLGLPMRQDEKSCPYYMRYGSCKFGVTCKFNHPQPASVRTDFPFNRTSAFGSTGSSAMSSRMPHVGGVPSWSFSSAMYVYDPRLQGSQAYMPVVLSPSQGLILASDWNAYSGSLSSPSFVGTLASPSAYNSRNRSASGLNAQRNLLATTSASLPERPDQPECRYFMSNGTCKYGPNCKYHHPRERTAQFAMGGLVSPHGLPLRPGQVICPNYTTYGHCNFGTNCRFDHPLLGYSYTYPYPAFSASSYSTFPGWIQKPSDGASSKHQNSDSDHLPEPAVSPPPRSSHSSSESPHDD